MKEREVCAVIKELVKLAAAATPSMMGGTPDMFGPEYSEKQIADTDSLDVWDCHEFYVRKVITRAIALLNAG